MSKLPGWVEPNFNSKASIAKWRRTLARILCVEPNDLDDFDVVDVFMRDMQGMRHRIAGKPQPPPAPATNPVQ